MKPIKICYTQRNNIGDSINPYIIKEVLHMEPICTNMASCEITGIGSGLRRFFLEPKSSGNIVSIIKGRSNPHPLIIWSAGFLKTPSGKEVRTRNRIRLASARGALSKKYIETIIGQETDASTGDAGLLVSELLTGKIEKKYKLGIIPHDRDRDLEIVHMMHKKNSDSVIIDVTGDVMKTLELIASCETIVSSSLHGLIISDSFHIPNLHIKLSERLAGDGFKFRDYYSSYNLDDEEYVLTSENYMDISSSCIIDRYRVSSSDVEKKKIQIKEAFYRYLK